MISPSILHRFTRGQAYRPPGMKRRQPALPSFMRIPWFEPENRYRFRKLIIRLACVHTHSQKMCISSSPERFPSIQLTCTNILSILYTLDEKRILKIGRKGRHWNESGNDSVNTQKKTDCVNTQKSKAKESIGTGKANY